MLSCQSLMPAGAGAPGLENGGWLLELFACHLPPSATPLDSRLRGNDDLGGILREPPFSCQSLMPAGAGAPMKTE